MVEEKDQTGLAYSSEVVLSVAPPFKAGDLAVLLHDTERKDTAPHFVTIASVERVHDGVLPDAWIARANYYGNVIEFTQHADTAGALVFVCVTYGYENRWTLHHASEVSEAMRATYTIAKGTVKGTI